MGELKNTSFNFHLYLDSLRTFICVWICLAPLNSTVTSLILWDQSNYIQRFDTISNHDRTPKMINILITILVHQMIPLIGPQKLPFERQGSKFIVKIHRVICKFPQFKMSLTTIIFIKLSYSICLQSISLNKYNYCCKC